MKIAIFLILLALFKNGSSQKWDRYIYSHASCKDLQPRHALHIPETTTATSTISTNQNNESSTRSTTTRKTTSIFIPAPPEANKRLSANINVDFPNKNYYAPGRKHTINITSDIEFEGFMIQVLRGSSSKVGYFMSHSSIVNPITCPPGIEGEDSPNTAIDSTFPVLLKQVKVVWIAPPKNIGRLTIKVSVVLENNYKIVEKNIFASDLPPIDSDNCGVRQSCFRMCSPNEVLCKPADAYYTAMISPENRNRSAKITIGTKSGLMKNFGAIGFTDDKKNLKNMDLNLCYFTESEPGIIKPEHLFLVDRNDSPLKHQGVIKLANYYRDDETFWCTFSRPLKGNDATRLFLENPVFIYFFTGHQHDNEFEIPERKAMQRTHKKVSLSDGLPFNSIVYVSTATQKLQTQMTFCLFIFLHAIL